MSQTKNECEIVNRLSRKVEKELSENMDKVNEDIAEINERLENVAEIDDTTASDSTTYSSEKIEELISDIPTGAEIDDTVTTTNKTWSSSKIKTEIDAGGGGGSGFEPKYTMTKQFYGLSTSYLEKINTLTDFPEVNIEAGKMYLVCWGVYKRGTGGVDSMNANFKLEILSNNQVQRSIEVNQPNGSNEPIFGTSIQPFTLLVNSSASNIGFKLYGNNSNGEKSTWFDFVMNIYELGNIN
jgi:hypothetical protein